MASVQRLALGTLAVAVACVLTWAPMASGAVPATVVRVAREPRVLPGPTLLHMPLAAAPQLQNTGPWHATPILVSGASAYRKGEFLYQDYLYDDSGAGGSATYPSDPQYVANLADLVEVRLRLTPRGTAFRITYNSMTDPERVGTTLALGGTAGTSYPLPHEAHAAEPASLFVTVHGHTADVLRAATGQRVAAAPPVTVDRYRRQTSFTLPYADFDPRGRSVRVAAASGLWDRALARYLQLARTADATHPGGCTVPPCAALFNVAFRYAEAAPTVSASAPWMNSQQSEALTQGDLSPFFATVDFRRLALGVSDDMPGRVGGVPRYGSMDRIYASHFEPQQGRGASTAEVCGPPHCYPPLSGRLQPYSLYVPRGRAPRGGWPVTIMTHPSNGNHNSYVGSPLQSALGDRGAGSLVIGGAGRGGPADYFGYAGTDIFEAWADVAARYPVNWLAGAATGISGGGWGTHLYSVLYPDLFARTAAIVGRPSAPVAACKMPGVVDSSIPGSSLYPLQGNLRNVDPFEIVNLTDELNPYPCMRTYFDNFARLGQRYRAWQLTADHMSLSRIMALLPAAVADWLGTATVDPDPARVTYTVSTQLLDQPVLSMHTDHAYWVSGIAPRAHNPALASVDVTSRGFERAQPVASGKTYGAGILPGAAPLPYASESQTWGASSRGPVVDALVITARNVAALTIDVRRAHITCGAHLQVDSDGPLRITLAGC